MHTKVAITFWQRGLPGLLCIGLGIALGFMCRQASPWPDGVKHAALPLALTLAIGGAPLVGSYVHQRSWAAMRNELLALGVLLGALLVLQASGVFGAQ